jgi:transcriptional antiterminator NusG
MAAVARLIYLIYQKQEKPMARWYIIHAYSGFENKVRESILHEAERKGLSQLVEQVEVPAEQITEVKRGKKIQVERKTMPGYVLAKLTLNDDVYHLVKNTAKVTGFLGPNGKPQAISEADAARYFGAREQAATQVKKHVTVDYEIGDAVKVLDGPFASFNGIVEELDFDKSRVKVSVSIFGRATPVELDFEHVERQK